MTNDEKKYKLKAYIRASEKIADLNDEIAIMQSKVNKITPTLSDMPKGSGYSDKSKIIDTYVDMMADLELEIKRLRNVKREVEYLISTIDDWTVERIMRLRYISGLRWEDICCKVNYSWAQVHRYHAEGLKYIEINHDTQ
jgi:hypothetical protein